MKNLPVAPGATTWTRFVDGPRGIRASWTRHCAKEETGQLHWLLGEDARRSFDRIAREHELRTGNSFTVRLVPDDKWGRYNKEMFERLPVFALEDLARECGIGLPVDAPIARALMRLAKAEGRLPSESGRGAGRPSEEKRDLAICAQIALFLLVAEASGDTITQKHAAERVKKLAKASRIDWPDPTTMAQLYSRRNAHLRKAEEDSEWWKRYGDATLPYEPLPEPYRHILAYHNYQSPDPVEVAIRGVTVAKERYCVLPPVA